MRWLFFNRIRAIHKNTPISFSLTLALRECLNSLRINEIVCEVEMKNHDYTLFLPLSFSLFLFLDVYYNNKFCPKRTNKRKWYVRIKWLNQLIT